MVGPDDRFRRKISANRQLYFPPRFRQARYFYIPEPGTIYPINEVRYYPEHSPPEYDGELDGEQLKISLTPQGTVTIPKRFFEKTGFSVGDYVWIESYENGSYYSLKMAPEPKSTDENDSTAVDDNKT